MKTTHTKGECKVIKNGLSGRFSPPRKQFMINSVDDNGVGHIATVHVQFDENDEESEANAKLIAAAPDLLETLQNFVGSCSGTFLQDSELCKNAEKAIKKATE